MRNKKNGCGTIIRCIRAFNVSMACVFLFLFGSDARVLAAPGYEKVAPAYDNVKGKSVAKYGMVPVYGKDIQDGVYHVDTECSSYFFRILDAELTVADGQMQAVMTMSSSSYECVFMGTGKEAAKADASEYIPREDDKGRHTFTVPVEALNTELNCAAFSIKRQQWYDRRIVFEASSLPAEALSFTLPDYSRIEDAVHLYDKTNGTDTKEEFFQAQQQRLLARASGNSSGQDASRQGAGDGISDGSEKPSAENDPEDEGGPIAVDTEESDGEYSIEATLTGGSGRASVSSPAWLFIRDGKAYAKLLWSSPYYDYMILSGQTFYNETTDGSNSTFTVPITAFDEPMEVIADTTAMGDPLEIAYTLTFYSDTIGDKGKVPQEAAKRVLLYAVIIIIGGGIVNYYVKKRAGMLPATNKKKKTGFSALVKRNHRRVSVYDTNDRCRP